MDLSKLSARMFLRSLLPLTSSALNSVTRNVSRNVVVAGVLSLMLIACSGQELTRAGSPVPGDKPLRMYEDEFGWCGDDFSDIECDQLKYAAQALSFSSNAQCQDWGNTFLDALVNNPGGVFVGGSAVYSQYDMYVGMEWGGQTFSGYHATDGKVHVNKSAFAFDSQDLGALMAHEMQHVTGNDGPGHNMGTAAQWQSTCYDSM